MNATTRSKVATNESPCVLRAKLRMGYYLLLLFLIHLTEAKITFPFVGHTSSTQNVIYGLIVTIPFVVITILFLFLTHKDLSTARRH